MEFFTPGLKGAKNSGTQQSANVLAHAKQHREAHQIALVGHHAADARQHCRREEKGAAEPQQELAEHQLVRARQAVGLTVEQGGNHDKRQRRGGGPVQTARV